MGLTGMLRAAMAIFLFALSIPAVPAAGESDPERGRRLFFGCIACHAIKGKGGDSAPDLAGLFGRRAGSLPGYSGYSAAMKAAAFEWSEDRLDAWLADPNGFLPGNAMAYPGLRSERDRKDLIAWLRAETAPRTAGD